MDLSAAAIRSTLGICVYLDRSIYSSIYMYTYMYGGCALRSGDGGVGSAGDNRDAAVGASPPDGVQGALRNAPDVLSCDCPLTHGWSGDGPPPSAALKPCAPLTARRRPSRTNPTHGCKRALLGASAPASRTRRTCDAFGSSSRSSSEKNSCAPRASGRRSAPSPARTQLLFLFHMRPAGLGRLAPIFWPLSPQDSMVASMGRQGSPAPGDSRPDACNRREPHSAPEPSAASSGAQNTYGVPHGRK